MLIAAFLFSFPLFQEGESKGAAPSTQVEDDNKVQQSASLAWQELLSKFSASNTINARIALNGFLATEAQDAEQLIQSTTINISACQPSFGQLQMNTKFSMFDGHDWQEHEAINGIIGNHEGLVLFDGIAKQFWGIGDSWSTATKILPDIAPLMAWAGVEITTPKDIQWDLTRQRGDWKALSFNETYYQHIYWLDKDNTLQLIEQLPIGVAAKQIPRLMVEFSWLELKISSNEDASSYAAKLPKGYTKLDAPGRVATRKLTKSAVKNEPPPIQ